MIKINQIMIIKKIQQIKNKLFIICAKINNKINCLVGWVGFRFTSNQAKARFIYNNNLSNYSRPADSFLLPFILQQVGGDITNESEPLVRYLLFITILSVIVLAAFINVFGYIFSLYLIPKFQLDKKFPKLEKYIRYFEKSSF
jgi:hypothetical protein